MSVQAKYRLLSRIALVLWMALILFLSSRSSLPADSPVVAWLGQYQDEVGHLGEYAILGMLAYLSLLPSFGRRRAWMLSLAFGVVFALADEAFQSTIPNRTAQVTDIIIDVVAVSCSLVFLAVLVPRFIGYVRGPG